MAVDNYLVIPDPIYSDEKVDWLGKVLFCIMIRFKQNYGEHPNIGALCEIMGRKEEWIEEKISRLKELGYYYYED